MLGWEEADVFFQRMAILSLSPPHHGVVLQLTFAYRPSVKCSGQCADMQLGWKRVDVWINAPSGVKLDWAWS
jgi:hypothetical protein